MPSVTTKVYAEKGTDEQNNENWIFSQNTALQEITVNLEKNEKTKCFEITLPESRGVSKGLLELEIKTNDWSLDIKTCCIMTQSFQYERRYQISNGPFSSVFCIKQRGKRYHTPYAAKYLRANTERAKREVSTAEVSLTHVSGT